MKINYTQRGLKRVKMAFVSFFLFLLHLPFVFAKSVNFSITQYRTTTPTLSKKSSSLNDLVPSVVPAATNVYDSLRLNLMGLSRQAFSYAMKGFDYFVQAGKITNDAIISIVDFSKPSSQKRLYIIDVQQYKVLFHTWVAHGQKSGVEYATKFSNTPESNMSSLGFYRTETTYFGGNGYSLKLNGLERGFNDNAMRRDIVMHGAEYVNTNFINSQGYIGRSWGCPAVSPKMTQPIIDKIKNGTCLFIYSPDNRYLNNSRALNS